MIKDELIGFLCEYEVDSSYLLSDKNIVNLMGWWKEQRKNVICDRATTTVELYDWDRKMLSDLSVGKNISDKIRYLIRLGYLAEKLHLLDEEMMFLCKDLETGKIKLPNLDLVDPYW
jgi:hypothetical protein